MNTTILVKTFDRHWVFKRIIDSILKFYPNIPIVVVDDGKNPVGEGEYKYVRLPFDVGISAGRNEGLKYVETKYTWLCDDDYIVTKGTKVQGILDLLNQNVLDLCGLRIWDAHRRNEHMYFGIFEQSETKLDVHPTFHGHYDGWSVCDLIPNCFIGHTDHIRNVKWDPILKLNEHYDFFFRFKQAGYRVGIKHDAWIRHHHPREGRHYKRFRCRKVGNKINFRRYLERKHGTFDPKQVDWRAAEEVLP